MAKCPLNFSKLLFYTKYERKSIYIKLHNYYVFVPINKSCHLSFYCLPMKTRTSNFLKL